jgi:uncharacterized membrane protein YqhA
LERIFERLLWGSRLLVLVAVVAGVFMAAGAAFLATVNIFYLAGLLLHTRTQEPCTRRAPGCGPRS